MRARISDPYLLQIGRKIRSNYKVTSALEFLYLVPTRHRSFGRTIRPVRSILDQEYPRLRFCPFARTSCLLSILLCTPAPAWADVPRADASVATPGSKRTDFKRMTFEELARANDEYVNLSRRIGEIMRRTTNVGLDHEHVRDLVHFPTANAQALLLRLIRAEAGRLDGKVEPAADVRLIEDALDTLASFASFGQKKPNEASLEFDDLIEEINGRAKKHEYGPALAERLIDARTKIHGRPLRLPDLDVLMGEHLNGSSAGARMDLDLTRKLLFDRIVGQDHILDGIMAQLWRDRTRPTGTARGGTFVVMGLDGTGHGEIVRAAARALHRYEAADLEHVHEVPVMQANQDLWTAMGSSSGFIGSETGVPEMVRWLVSHSAGKYRIDEEAVNTGGMRWSIKLNKQWQPGQVWENHYAPEDGFLFFDDLQNWSRSMKDRFLLPALRKRRFMINNPNGGLRWIDVPVNVYVATNEGSGLLTAREANGQRLGPPLPHARLVEKFDRVFDQAPALRSALLETNGAHRGWDGPTAPGISNQIVGAIDDGELYLTRPLAKEHLVWIARRELRKLSAEFAAGSSALLGAIKLDWSDALTDLVATYGATDEDQAVGIKGRLESLVREPIAAMVQADQLKTGPSGTAVDLDVRVNDDQTRDLVATVTLPGKSPYVIAALMRPTTRDRGRAAITDERIDQLKAMGPHLKSRVFGIDQIVDRLTDRALSVENAAGATKPRPAMVAMTDGLSSTGKTQLTLEFAAALLGNQDELLTTDFSTVQSLRRMQEEILGYRDANGNVVASRFMKAYDRGNGRVVMAMDELANVKDRDLLTTLHDLFRVAVMHTFADNVPRPMTRVVLLPTGNATQNVYTNIPTDLPMDLQMMAWEDVHNKISRDPAAQRFELGKTYPAPVLNRIQRNNTFLMPPHNWKTLRQLTQLKLGEALAQMRATRDRRGWDVLFPDLDAYNAFVDMIIADGFELHEQGASIEKFIASDFMEALEATLLTAKVPSGARVVLTRTPAPPAAPDEDDDDDDEEAFSSKHNSFTIDVENGAPLEFRMPRRSVPPSLEPDETLQRITALHEAGHAIVLRVALPGAYRPLSLSVRTAMKKIANEWLHIAGLARDRQRSKLAVTRDHVVRQIAVLVGGRNRRAPDHARGHSRRGQNERHLARVRSGAQRGLTLRPVDALGSGRHSAR